MLKLLENDPNICLLAYTLVGQFKGKGKDGLNGYVAFYISLQSYSSQLGY